VAERLIDWAKADGITLLCTSLLDEMARKKDAGTRLQISSLADYLDHLHTWSKRASATAACRS